MKKKEWFILINFVEEGPYSINELKKDLRLSPSTLVRRKDMKEWQAIGSIAELKDVFKDDERDILEEAPDHSKEYEDMPDSQLTLTVQSDPGNFIIWLIIILVIIIWVYFQLKYNF